VRAYKLGLVAVLVASCGSSGNHGDLALVQDLSTPSYDFSQPIYDFSATDGASPYCPTGTIPPSTTTLFAGDTSGGKDLVTDARISWANDPDHALLFVAPTSGTFRFSITSSNQPSTNDCGLILRDYGASGSGALYDESSCPTGLTQRALDANYAATPGGTTTDLAMTSGQHQLMFVSCSMFAVPMRTISYVVHVALQ
jgi:hypothetical protein